MPSDVMLDITAVQYLKYKKHERPIIYTRTGIDIFSTLSTYHIVQVLVHQKRVSYSVVACSCFVTHGNLLRHNEGGAIKRSSKLSVTHEKNTSTDVCLKKAAGWCWKTGKMVDDGDQI